MKWITIWLGVGVALAILRIPKTRTEKRDLVRDKVDDLRRYAAKAEEDTVSQ